MVSMTTKSYVPIYIHNKTHLNNNILWLCTLLLSSVYVYMMAVVQFNFWLNEEFDAHRVPKTWLFHRTMEKRLLTMRTRKTYFLDLINSRFKEKYHILYNIIEFTKATNNFFNDTHYTNRFFFSQRGCVQQKKKKIRFNQQYLFVK